MMNPKPTAGFTLIEMMIVVLIVAILATIAWPSYESFIRQTRLENARADLMDSAHMLERHYSSRHSFCNTVNINDPNADCHATPAINAANLPQTRSNNFFTISYAAGSPTSSDYELVARPIAGSSETRFLIYDSTNSMLLCEAANDCRPY